jgi:integrase
MGSVGLFDGKVRLYKRPNSKFWQCSSYLAGKNRRVSTNQEALPDAKERAENWYLELRGKDKVGLLGSTKTFAEVASVFLREYEILTKGERSPKWVEYLKLAFRVHLLPYFGDMLISEITPGVVQEYRIHRMENPHRGRVPARNTLNSEMIGVRHVLKTAHRHGWLRWLPDLSHPFKPSGKVDHRAWFSPTEYKQLYEATRARAKNPPKLRWKASCKDLHDKVLFLANTGLRPDEAYRLQYRDVTVAWDGPTKEHILEIEVRGKRGFGHCKSTANAVRPFVRLKKRHNPHPTDLVFPKRQRELFDAVLADEKLKFDRDGHRRTLYSLRHTYICFRLMEGANIYDVARNCRTSVEMIEKHYARHIKNLLDAASINVRRGKVAKSRREETAA